MPARNFETNRPKVNEADGNPVEVATVVVWQVADMTRAVRAVEDYVDFVDFVTVQAEAALRHAATTLPCDNTARARAGRDHRLRTHEVRISDLASAPEIAQAMLRRRQAAAAVAARAQIVEGAAGMVEMARAERRTSFAASARSSRCARGTRCPTPGACLARPNRCTRRDRPPARGD